jgi:hypothetical protein
MVTVCRGRLLDAAGVPLVRTVVSVTGQMVVYEWMTEVTTVALAGQSVMSGPHEVTVCRSVE